LALVALCSIGLCVVTRAIRYTARRLGKGRINGITTNVGLPRTRA